jgi:hypothetical protein
MLTDWLPAGEIVAGPEMFRYDDVPFSDAAVASVNGPATPRVTVLNRAQLPCTWFTACDPAVDSDSRQ